MEIQKNLKYENAVLKKESLSREEIRIKTLEGILAATEARLQYYIDKEAEHK